MAEIYPGLLHGQEGTPELELSVTSSKAHQEEGESAAEQEGRKLHPSVDSVHPKQWLRLLSHTPALPTICFKGRDPDRKEYFRKFFFFYWGTEMEWKKSISELAVD